MPRIKKASSPSLLQKLQESLHLNQSYSNLVVGFLIVLVAGILVFNYFKKSSPDLGPAQQTQVQEDVKPENLPGKYTIKEDDTLFKIAQTYYSDGDKYPEIASANKIADENLIKVGQIIEIPKLTVITQAQTDQGIGGAENQTIWGEKIIGDTYTVVEGDWLSKIAGRAYGDIMTYPKIAQANNIQNPDLIFPGQVLKIPR